MKQHRPTFQVLCTELMRKFRKRNSHLVALGEDLLWIEWQLCSLVAHLDSVFTPVTTMAMQQLHAYHREACLLCIRDQANVGLALVRMACELSRDLLLMARDPQAEKLWLGREEQGNQYRKLFRFDELTPSLGAALKDLYKIGCRFGVHGHMHFSDAPADRVTILGREFLLVPSDRNIALSSYSLNLAAIQLFTFAFLDQHGDPFRTASDTRIRDTAAQIVRHLGRIEIPFILPDGSNRAR
jgi:hypothetical protein